MAPRGINVLLVPATILTLLGPASANARESAPPEVEQPIEAPEVDEAKTLFDEGAIKFETADYAGAIELWTKAYGLVPSLPEYAAVKATLIANLATARERAYAVDHAISHLNQAKILIESYRTVLDDIYPDAEERAKELAWVVERVATIDAELEAVAAREAAARDAAARDAAARAAADRDNQPEPEPDEPEPRRAPGQGLVIGGSVLTGLGVAGLGTMIAGMVIGGGNNSIADIPTNDLDARATRFRQGRLGNTLAIVGAVGGAALVGTGVALLVVGLAKKKRAAGSSDAARATLVPIVDPTQMGLGLSGRF